MRARQKLGSLVDDSPFSRKLGATGPGSERSDRQLNHRLSAVLTRRIVYDHSGWRNLHRLREWFFDLLRGKQQLHIQSRWRLHGGWRVMSQLNNHLRSFARKQLI
jgi:hypothetical protein